MSPCWNRFFLLKTVLEGTPRQHPGQDIYRRRYFESIHRWMGHPRYPGQIRAIFQSQVSLGGKNILEYKFHTVCVQCVYTVCTELLQWSLIFLKSFRGETVKLKHPVLVYGFFYDVSRRAHSHISDPLRSQLWKSFMVDVPPVSLFQKYSLSPDQKYIIHILATVKEWMLPGTAAQQASEQALAGAVLTLSVRSPQSRQPQRVQYS